MDPPLILEDVRLTLSFRGTLCCPNLIYDVSINENLLNTCYAPIKLSGRQDCTCVGQYSVVQPGIKKWPQEANKRRSNQPSSNAKPIFQPPCPDSHHQIASWLTIMSLLCGELLVRVLPPGAPEPADPPVLEPSLPGATVTSDSTIWPVPYCWLSVKARGGTNGTRVSVLIGLSYGGGSESPIGWAGACLLCE